MWEGGGDTIKGDLLQLIGIVSLGAMNSIGLCKSLNRWF
jgi:hypothetical protein